MKKITLHIEEADGQENKVTGVHVDFGDGSAAWLTGVGIDEKQMRDAVQELVTKGLLLDKFVEKPKPEEVPEPDAFEQGDVQPLA